LTGPSRATARGAGIRAGLDPDQHRRQTGCQDVRIEGDVFEISRELIAYGMIGLIVVALVPWLVMTREKRRRERLRRRGDKRYGH